MGNISSINKINFEDLQIIQYNYNINNTIVINTLHSNNQNCLILNTLSALNEEETINSLLKK